MADSKTRTDSSPVTSPQQQGTPQHQGATAPRGLDIMTSHNRLSATITSIRNRVRSHPEYFTSELRTKYVLIDPVLRSLGWDTADPSRVSMEARFDQTNLIPDYALFRQGALAGLIEAKSMDTSQVQTLTFSEDWRQHQIREGFQKLQRGEDLQKTSPNLFHKDQWETLKQPNEKQLETYVRETRLKTGFAVLTNGDDWWIYDLAAHAVMEPNSPLRKALTAETSLLLDEIQKVTKTLTLLSHDREWPH